MYFQQDIRNLNFHSQINPENAKNTWAEYKDLSPLREAIKTRYVEKFDI